MPFPAPSNNHLSPSILTCYRFLLRTRFAVDCHHFADRNATKRVVLQKAEAMRLQRNVFGRGEGRPYHDRPLGRQRRDGISLRHQRLVGGCRLFATQRSIYKFSACDDFLTHFTFIDFI